MHYVKFTMSSGGVGRNIFEALSKLETNPRMLSCVGDDYHGDFILNDLPEKSKHFIVKIPKTTAQCTVVFDKHGECKLLLGEMDIFEQITPGFIKSHEDAIKDSSLIVTDGNLSIPAISTVLELAEKHNKPVFYEPTDVPVASKPFKTSFPKSVKFISPNMEELRMIVKDLGMNTPGEYKGVIEEALCLGKIVGEYVETVLVTLGSLGVMVIRKATAEDALLNPLEKTKNIRARYYKTDKVEKLVNVSGAGDCLASGIIAGMLNGEAESRCIALGFAAANMSLQNSKAIPPVLFDKKHKFWENNADYEELLK